VVNTQTISGAAEVSGYENVINTTGKNYTMEARTISGNISVRFS